MSETKHQIIEDCPDFMYGCCQKYLDGDCSAHKCDLKIIRELQQKLQAKEQDCEELRSQWYFSTKHKLVLESEYAFELNKYKQALDEIEKYQQRNCEVCVFANTQKCNINCQVFVILNIIHKSKEK